MRITMLIISLLLYHNAISETKDMNGKFELDYTQTLNDINNVSFRYWAGRKLNIETIFNMEVIDHNSLRSSTSIQNTVGIFYSIVQHRHANLSMGIRADVGFRTSPTKNPQSITSENRHQHERPLTNLRVDTEQSNKKMPTAPYTDVDNRSELQSITSTLNTISMLSFRPTQ